jgi:hypothetical protein
MADDPREIKMEEVKSVVERPSKEDAARSDNDDDDERR